MPEPGVAALADVISWGGVPPEPDPPRRASRRVRRAGAALAGLLTAAGLALWLTRPGAADHRPGPAPPSPTAVPAPAGPLPDQLVVVSDQRAAVVTGQDTAVRPLQLPAGAPSPPPMVSELVAVASGVVVLLQPTGCQPCPVGQAVYVPAAGGSPRPVGPATHLAAGVRPDTVWLQVTPPAAAGSTPASTVASTVALADLRSGTTGRPVPIGDRSVVGETYHGLLLRDLGPPSGDGALWQARAGTAPPWYRVGGPVDAVFAVGPVHVIWSSSRDSCWPRCLHVTDALARNDRVLALPGVPVTAASFGSAQVDVTRRYLAVVLSTGDFFGQWQQVYVLELGTGTVRAVPGTRTGLGAPLTVAWSRHAARLWVAGAPAGGALLGYWPLGGALRTVAPPLPGLTAVATLP